MDSFNGVLKPKVYDKPVTLQTLNNDFEYLEPFNFDLQQSILYAGNVNVEDGLFDFEQRLNFLYKERTFLENRLKSNNEFAEKFDAQIGPFEKMYDKLTDGMTSLYDNAKTEHKKGIDVLIREFNYHPLWKQSNDCFNATPFKPE